MNFYPKDQKAAVVKKLIELANNPSPPIGAIAEIARQAGIPGNTVYNWNADLKHKAKSFDNAPTSDTGGTWSSVAKFHAVLITAKMSELELGEYLRTNGLLKEELEAWRHVCETANDTAATTARKYRSALTAEQTRTKKLEAELTRKEKALAETAALLVLRGKAGAIWGAAGDE